MPVNMANCNSYKTYSVLFSGSFLTFQQGILKPSRRLADCIKNVWAGGGARRVANAGSNDGAARFPNRAANDLLMVVYCFLYFEFKIRRNNSAKSSSILEFPNEYLYTRMYLNILCLTKEY